MNTLLKDQYVVSRSRTSQKGPLLLVCQTQNRAKTAYEFSPNSGLTNCSVPEAGMTGRVNEEKPVVRG